MEHSPAPLPQSREEEAASALNSTGFFPGARTLLLTGFSLISAAGFLAAAFGSVSGVGEDNRNKLRPLLLGLLPNETTLAGLKSPLDLWHLFPSPEAMRRVEKALEERSSIVAALRPHFQTLLYRLTGVGNEQAVPAPGGWLFFRKDLDYLNGKPFLDPAVQLERTRAESTSPDSLSAVVDFHTRLASLGIQLLVVPVPVKPCIEAHRFTPAASSPGVFRHNASYPAWIQALREQGVQVFDPTPLLYERALQTGAPQYLRTDTHWTPEAMEAVAEAVARHIQPTKDPASLPNAEDHSLQVTAYGDTVALLGLLKDQSLIPPETVTIRPVLQNTLKARAMQDLDVLILGDSFCNIYSLASMGWGESAGFSERLAAHLGRPVDSITRNSDGAFATRQTLQKELSTNTERLRGKKTVVWEFAARELAFGDWKSLPLPQANPQARSFFCPPNGTKQRIQGVVSSAARVPRAGSVPYKEHIVAIHLVNVTLEGGKGGPPKECIVYTWSMREQQLCAAAFLRPGEAVSLEVIAWEDVAETLDKFHRSELEDPSLLFEAPTWADALR